MSDATRQARAEEPRPGLLRFARNDEFLLGPPAMPDHAHSTDPAVQAQLDRLAALSPGRDILGLERIAELCDRLGNPPNRLPRTFHVAGTTGKGSTCAYLRAILHDRTSVVEGQSV